jgi:nucleotide-binding universal stress UspA family protein
MNFKRILCPIELSSVVQFGIKPAVSLAGMHRAELILVHVVDYPPPGLEFLLPPCHVARVVDQQRSATRAQLEEMVKRELDTSSTCKCMVRIGTPHHEIVELAREEAVDLIVLPTRGTSVLERWFQGSTVDKVIRSAPCPVLSVPPQRTLAYSFHPRKIVFATDFSDCADRAFSWALSLAEIYDSELLMVHVATVYEAGPTKPTWRFPAFASEFLMSLEDAAAERLAARASGVGEHRVALQTRILRGIDPALTIVNYAKEEAADLVVLATHGRSGLAHVVLGSTAERVVRHSRGPVLTVRNPEQLATRGGHEKSAVSARLADENRHAA